MLFYIILLVSLIFCILKRQFNLTNPLFFLWSSWIAALLICLGNVFSSYSSLTLKTLYFVGAFLLLTTISFYLGKSFKFALPQVSYNRFILINAFDFLFILVVLSYVLTIIRLGLPPIFTGADRSQYYLSGGGELLYLLIYPCFFLGLFLIQQELANTKKPKIYIELLLLAMIIATRGNKMAIFSVILMLLFFFGKRVNLLRLLFLALLVIIIFSMVSSIYKKNIEDHFAFKVAKISLTGFTLPDFWYFLYDPFIYLSSNINNLDGLITNHFSGIGLGAMSFKGIYQIAALFNPSLNDVLNNARTIINNTLTIPLFSTFSGLGDLYYDFGPFIALEIMIIIALFAGITNGGSSSPHTSLSESYISFLLFQTLALSFFTFYLGNLEVITNVIVVCLIDFLAQSSNYDGEYLNE